MYKTILLSTVTKNDFQVFKVGIDYIFKFIKPSMIELAVPDDDYIFISNSLKNIKNINIKKDSEYITSKESIILRSALNSAFIPHMYGWYLQQIIKIKMCASCTDDSVAVIWDADTIPLRPINFVNSNGSLTYFVSDEYHQPYFDTMGILTKDEKFTTYSFISQCFPIYPTYARDYIKEAGADNFVEQLALAVLDSCEDPNVVCRYSEYESLGNFIIRKCPELISFNHSPWLRAGAIYKYFFRSFDRACLFLKDRYAFVAFEKSNQFFLKWFLQKLYHNIRNFVVLYK